MPGYFALVLHAHLPFVRHPEHERFLEENWLFEAITEAYVPLLQLLEGWRRDHMSVRLTLTLTPTLCAMLLDPLLRRRYLQHLNQLIELSEREIHRTLWQASFQKLAHFYHERFQAIRLTYQSWDGDLVAAFRKFQELGLLEIITSAATHALLPFLTSHPPSLRAQLNVGRDYYRQCFGCEPRGIWLPECAYVEGIDEILQELNIRWFILDSHGILNARPKPRYALFAPVFTSGGVAAFGRDLDSARQVWSRHEGYPGDLRYRDFYRDIGFDLDLDYLKLHSPVAEQRSFTGIKYFRITGPSSHKEIYDRSAAAQAADGHATHFLQERMTQIQRLSQILDRPPLIVAPYDAELFGHWWYEGPEFLDYFVRKAIYDQSVFKLITPEDYLRWHPTNQVATPSPSSWGEGGYWSVWLNEKNEWILPHLQVAQERMTELARRFSNPDALQERTLNQAARELLLAQASDWPFVLRTGTSPGYARQRVTDHLQRFTTLHEELIKGSVDETSLREIENRDNIFPELNYRLWS